MSTTVSPSNSAPAAPPKRRLRRVVLASALVLGGFAVGVGSSAISQGYGPGRAWSEDGGPGRGWHGPHGWMHDGYHRGWDRDGDRGWHRGGDWHRGDWHRGGWHHGRRYGHPGFGPGSIERMIDRAARATDASSEQRDKMNVIAQRAGGQLMALREKHLAGRRQVREILAAPTIDRAKLESVRAEQIKLADEASRHITAALADVAEVLSPSQRADLARRLERRMGGRP